MMDDEFTTDSLSLNMHFVLQIGTPRYLRVILKSIICSAQILAATNSEPYVTVSTVACFLEYQSIGVAFIIWSMSVTDYLDKTSWNKLTST